MGTVVTVGTGLTGVPGARRLLGLLLCGAAAVASSCVSSGDADADAPAPLAPPAQGAKRAAAESIGNSWEQQLSQRLSQDPAHYHDAWALFSAGGWADNGQIMLYATADHQHLHAYLASPGAKLVTSDHSVEPADFTARLAPALKAADQLADLNPVAFDALTYYYVHMVRDGNKVTVVKRLTIRNTGKVKSPAHDQVIAALQSLRP